MRKFLSKVLLKITDKKSILDLLDIQELNKRLTNSRIVKCNNQVTMRENSRFYEEAVVFNFNADKSKILISENTHIRGELLVFKYDGKISIGDNCFIGAGSKIWSGEFVEIGNNVLISHNVNIIDTNSHEINHLERAERFKELINNGHWKTKGSIKTSPIIIEDFVWISFNAIILKGVTVGKGAIVAAGAVVTKDVPAWSIVAGNPARVVRMIPEDER